MLKISLAGKCKSFKIIPKNGFPARCSVMVELGQEILGVFPVYEIEISIPTELATLLELGRPMKVTLEQNGH